MDKNARILIACEESGVVTEAFRDRGFVNAWSCDLLPTSGGHPEWHLQQDVVPLLSESWDMVLAFPPCTHLCASGARLFPEKRADGRQQEAIDFFMLFARLDCPKVAIENPVGIMSRLWRKPDQIIQPWMFGEEARKKTCLWLKGLPSLIPTSIVGEGELSRFASGKVMPKWYADAWRLPPDDRARIRSKTFPGIARAMAEQWGGPMAQ